MMCTGKSLRRLIRASMLAILPVVTAGLTAGPALPQAIVSTGESFVTVSLVPGRAEPGGVRMAGLVVDLEPEWKTYWRSPGAAGVPPEFDWSGSRNVAAAEVLWPRPHFFESFGLDTLGYAERVVIPVRLVPEDPARPMQVRLRLALGVCRDICVLEDTSISASIAADTPEQGAALVAAAEAEVPGPAATLGLSEVHCRIGGAGGKRSFEATLAFDRPLESPEVVLEGPELAWFSGVETTHESGTGRVRVAAELSLLDEKAWIGRSDIRMTVLATDFAADVQGCAVPRG